MWKCCANFLAVILNCKVIACLVVNSVSVVVNLFLGVGFRLEKLWLTSGRIGVQNFEVKHFGEPEWHIGSEFQLISSTYPLLWFASHPIGVFVICCVRLLLDACFQAARRATLHEIKSSRAFQCCRSTSARSARRTYVSKPRWHNTRRLRGWHSYWKQMRTTRAISLAAKRGVELGK